MGLGLMEKIYAKGLTKKEYYREYEELHREERNAYRRKLYRDKCVSCFEKGE